MMRIMLTTALETQKSLAVQDTPVSGPEQDPEHLMCLLTMVQMFKVQSHATRQGISVVVRKGACDFYAKFTKLCLDPEVL